MNICFKQWLLVIAFIALSRGDDFHQILVHKVRTDFLNLEDDLWDFILGDRKDKTLDPGVYIVKEFYAFDQKVQQLPQDILYGMEVPKKLEEFLTLYSDVRVVYDMYDKFRRYQDQFLSTSKKDYVDYMKVISVSAMVNDILYDEKNNMNKTVTSIQHQMSKLQRSLRKITSDDSRYNCEHPRNPVQQLYYNVYNLIALAELKGYILYQFALMALRLQEKGNHTELSIRARNQYQEQSKRLHDIFSNTLRIFAGEMYACDPPIHVEGVTYEKLTRLIQAHVVNEVDLNKDNSCTNTCDSYVDTISFGCYDSSSEYCQHAQPCRGRIYNCKFIESHFTTCLASPGSNRRYDYIEYSSGKLLGQKTSCSKKTVNSWLRWFVHCSYCLCYCDEQSLHSDRFFNLRPKVADVQKNRVVTGMRFVKSRRIVHIQIQEGELLPYGYINQSTVRWVPVDDYGISTAGVVRGRDYHTMSYTNRSMLLGNTEVPYFNYVITGARFVLLGGDFLKFQIQATRFDFATGHLYVNEAEEISTFGFSARINLDQSDIPTKSPSSTDFYSRNSHVEFTHTDLYKDAGQTTIPFIDIQPVHAKVALPLQAAGIYYKTSPGYGGFVGMNIETYDFSHNFVYSFPKYKERLDTEEIFKVIEN